MSKTEEWSLEVDWKMSTGFDYNQVTANLYQQMQEGGKDKTKTQRTEMGVGSDNIFTREYLFVLFAGQPNKQTNRNI